jgi:hypothetical protein
MHQFLHGNEAIRIAVKAGKAALQPWQGSAFLRAEQAIAVVISTAEGVQQAFTKERLMQRSDVFEQEHAIAIAIELAQARIAPYLLAVEAAIAIVIKAMKQFQHSLAVALNRHGILGLQRRNCQQAQQQRQGQQQAVHGFTLWSAGALLTIARDLFGANL